MADFGIGEAAAIAAGEASAAAATTAAASAAATAAAAGASAATITAAGSGIAAATTSSMSLATMASLSLTAASVGRGAYGMYQQGQMQSAQAQAAAAEAAGQQQIANYNGQVAGQNAAATRQQAVYRQQLQSQEASRQESRIRAAAGASGFVTTTGSPLVALATQKTQDQLSNLMIGYQGQIGVSQAQSQAVMDQMQGDIYGMKSSNLSASAGNYAMAGDIGAGTSILQGFGRELLRN